MSLAHKLILALAVGACSLNRSGPVSRSGKSVPFGARACSTGVVSLGTPTSSAVFLNAGRAQPVQAVPVHLRLPAQELFRGQPVAGTRVAHGEQATAHGR